jgi:L-threonylcarbamoyladenylate synthase
MHIISTNTQDPDNTAIAAAVKVLQNGDIIAYLTDTLYGLGGDARSTIAIEKIFALKGRATEKALPVIVGEKEIVKEYVEEIPAVAAKLIEQFWPGPLTLIFRAAAPVPPELIGHSGKIAMRLPAAKLAREISRKLGAPIIATSANRSGEPVLNSAGQIAKAFGTHLALILDSGLPVQQQPSTIIDVTTQPPLLVRAGAIPATEITGRIGELKT